MATTLEVGKKYKNTDSGNIVECLYVGNDRAFIRTDGGLEYSVSKVNFDYEEYIEPKKRVLYMNVYESPRVCLYSPAQYDSREKADKCAVPGRVGCIRVELVEGKYDD